MDERLYRSIDAIRERLDALYDRVSEVQSEILLLRWKIAAISSSIGAAMGGLFALLSERLL